MPMTRFYSLALENLKNESHNINTKTINIRNFLEMLKFTPTPGYPITTSPFIAEATQIRPHAEWTGMPMEFLLQHQFIDSTSSIWELIIAQAHMWGGFNRHIRDAHNGRCNTLHLELGILKTTCTHFRNLLNRLITQIERNDWETNSES